MDFLFKQFKKSNDAKLKAYIFQSILIISQNDKLRISMQDESILNNNFDLLKTIGVVKQNKTKSKHSEPINFRSKLKDHIKDLEDKKRLNERMTGF